MTEIYKIANGLAPPSSPRQLFLSFEVTNIILEILRCTQLTSEEQ